ncbi:MAG: rseP [Gammaproteobacteria bacterium]|jgi:regulator of sigma E protease|nr:rseP [Gammaproteobacteria bacterium]
MPQTEIGEKSLLAMLISILSIFLTIFFIVGIHECGHFFIARLAGIKVLRFSLGFGKALFRWQDKKGTEFVLATIPLGGYVKMLDENEEKVTRHEYHLAFNRQPLYKKIAVVIAGPAANFIFAFILYWLLFVIGFTTPIPLIGKIIPHSLAENAGLKPGDEIQSINNKTTLDWNAVVIRLMTYLGEKKQIAIHTQSLNSRIIQRHTLDLRYWQINNLKPNPLDSLGIEPYRPPIPLVIGILLPHSPAYESRLQVNDIILAIGQKRIKNWEELVALIAAHPEETLVFKIKRQEKILFLPITIGYKRNYLFQKQGFLGLAPQFKWPDELLRKNKFSPFAALVQAKQQLTIFTSLNFSLLGKMLTGKVSLQGLGGPITVFESAGTALNNGILPFISFLAFFSIAIGVINVLPIPGLDGGHLLFYLIESITRRPLSMRVQTLLFRLGIIVLLLLITQAVVNDFMRLSL